MQRQAVDPFVPPQNVTNFHQIIVNHHGEMIRRNTVRFHQNHILQIGVLKRNVTANHIMNRYLALKWKLGPHRMAFTLGDSFCCFSRAKIATMAIVATQALFLTFLAHCGQPLGRAETTIRIAHINELLAIFLIDVESFGLSIGAVVATFFWTFIPIKPQIAQPIE